MAFNAPIMTIMIAAKMIHPTQPDCVRAIAGAVLVSCRHVDLPMLAAGPMHRTRARR